MRPRRRLLPLLFAFLGAAALMAAPRPSRAQVNAESLRPNPLRPGWSGGLDASVSLSRGNIQLFDVGGAARLQYQTLHPAPAQPAPGEPPSFKLRAMLVANGRFAEKGGNPIVSQAYAHARFTQMWHPRVGTDVFAQVQYNRFWRLKARFVTGLGLRAHLVHRRGIMLWAGAGYMFEYNRTSPLESSGVDAETFEHRLTTYLAARVDAFGERLLLQNIVYLQPRFDAPTDLQVLNELELQTKVTDLLTVGATMALLYNSAPPEGIVPTDLRLLSSARLSF